MSRLNVMKSFKFYWCTQHLSTYTNCVSNAVWMCACPCSKLVRACWAAFRIGPSVIFRFHVSIVCGTKGIPNEWNISLQSISTRRSTAHRWPFHQKLHVRAWSCNAQERSPNFGPVFAFVDCSNFTYLSWSMKAEICMSSRFITLSISIRFSIALTYIL